MVVPMRVSCAIWSAFYTPRPAGESGSLPGPGLSQMLAQERHGPAPGLPRRRRVVHVRVVVEEPVVGPQVHVDLDLLAGLAHAALQALPLGVLALVVLGQVQQNRTCEPRVVGDVGRDPVER